MEDDILEEIHKYDNLKLLKKYKIDLWSVVYLLILWNYINYGDFIFTLKSRYYKKYYNEDLKKTWSSNYDTNYAIERKLQKLCLINKNGNISCITHDGKTMIDKIYFDINWNVFQKIKRYVKEHNLANYLFSLIWLLK